MSRLRATAVVSMLHQPARGHSADVRLRGTPVLRHTLGRIASTGLPAVVLAWEDQLAAARDAGSPNAEVFSAGPRAPRPAMEAIAAALRWSDGWRTTLARCCAFDAGFDARATLSATGDAEAVLLVDPASALIDPQLLTGLLAHAADHPDRDWFYLPTAPGMSAVLLRRAYLTELDRTRRHPGLALHYHPDRFGADPVSTPHCAPAPTALCRTLANFRLDRPDRIEHAQACPGVVEATRGDDVLVRWTVVPPPLPRDLRLDITRARRTRPVFMPPPASDPPAALPLERIRTLLAELHRPIDPGEGFLSPTRVTLGGVGDPLLHPDWPAVLAEARQRGIPVCIETDLVGLSEDAWTDLAQAPWDVLLVHLPAACRSTYLTVMGVDAFDGVMQALQRMVALAPGRLVVPVFTQLAANLAQMEPWYDHFIRALGVSGGGIVQSASTYAGRIPDPGGPDLTPPARVACRRLSSRLTVLACGSMAACENDLEATLLSPTGGSVRHAWGDAMPVLRRAHDPGGNLPALCRQCRDYFRP